MVFRKRDKKPVDEINLLTIIPVRQIEWQEDEDGKVELLKPKFSNRTLQNFLGKWMKQTHFKVKLDNIGTSVWKAIDGNKTIEQIGNELHAKLGKEIEPVFERLGQFISQLHRSGFISIHND